MIASLDAESTMTVRVNLPALLAALAAPLCLLCLSSAHSASAERFCVVGSAAFGCFDQREIIQLTNFHGDVDALRRDIAGSLQSGACRMFSDGEFVLSGSDPGPWRSVRRPGDDVSFWLPSTWTRPAGECAVYARSRSIERSLGMAALSAPTLPAPPLDPAMRVAPRINVAAQRCEIKAVMTDAEIAACRNSRR